MVPSLSPMQADLSRLGGSSMRPQPPPLHYKSSLPAIPVVSVRYRAKRTESVSVWPAETFAGGGNSSVLRPIYLAFTK